MNNPRLSPGKQIIANQIDEQKFIPSPPPTQKGPKARALALPPNNPVHLI